MQDSPADSRTLGSGTLGSNGKQPIAVDPLLLQTLVTVITLLHFPLAASFNQFLVSFQMCHLGSKACQTRENQELHHGAEQHREWLSWHAEWEI